MYLETIDEKAFRSFLSNGKEMQVQYPVSNLITKEENYESYK